MQHHINSYKEKELPVSPYKAEIPDDPTVLEQTYQKLRLFSGARTLSVSVKCLMAYYNHRLEGNTIKPSFKYAIVVRAAKATGRPTPQTVDWIFDSVSFQAYQSWPF
jgi:hypothetical protein